MHKRILSHDEIFLSSAISFNDPFDCTIPVRYDKATKQEIFRKSVEYVQKENPQIKRKEARMLARKQMKKGIYKDPVHLEHFYNEFQSQVRYRNFGILSLTEEENNIVMWSHYADSHKGFCVGFDARKLSKLGQVIYQQLGKIIDLRLYKVEYQDDYPFFDALKMNSEEFLVKPLITKASQWKYEKEYRLISPDGSDRRIQLSDGVIVKVIFGCKMPDQYKEEIKNLLKDKDPKVELFQATLKAESFGLDFEQIV